MKLRPALLAALVTTATTLSSAPAEAVVPVVDEVTVVETYENAPDTVLVARCSLNGTAPGSATVQGTATLHSSTYTLNFISITCTVHQPLANDWQVSNIQSGNSVTVNGSGQLLIPTPPWVCVSGQFQVSGGSFIDDYGNADCVA